MKNNFNIGSRLLELRTNLGLSQEQLALRAEITTTYLGQIEHNTKRATVFVVEKLCSALNISLSEFFRDEDYLCKYDMVTDQILLYLQECTVEEKHFVLAMCKQLKCLQHSAKLQTENSVETQKTKKSVPVTALEEKNPDGEITLG